jgi:hypothetical protein
VTGQAQGKVSAAAAVVRRYSTKASGDRVDRGTQGEQLVGDELVEVVGTDRVPLDAIGGDGHLGQQGLYGGGEPVGGEAPLSDRPDDLIFGRVAHPVEHLVKGGTGSVPVSAVEMVAATPDAEAFGPGDMDAVQRPSPGAAATVAFMLLRRG